MEDEDQVTYVYCASCEVFRVMQSFGVALQTALRGVLAMASARAWPRVHARRETKPQLRARKVVCIPLLIPQPDRERYQFFSVSYHI